MFVFGCVWSSLPCEGFLQLWQAGATLCCGAWASHCGGFSCCGAWALGTWASIVVAHGLSSCGSQALEHRLSSCGAWAYLLCGTWDLPGPGLEPVSPALAGGFSTTMPPGKSPAGVIFWYIASIHKLGRNVFLCNSGKRKEVYNWISPQGHAFCTMERRTLLSISPLDQLPGCHPGACSSSGVQHCLYWRVDDKGHFLALWIVSKGREKPFGQYPSFGSCSHLTVIRRIKVLSSPERGVIANHGKL